MIYRSDSAGFTQEIMDYCTKNNITYFLRAKEFGSLKREAYGCEFIKLTIQTHAVCEKEISEFVYSMKELPIRIITTREKLKTDLPMDIYDTNARRLCTDL